ncbi:hypothetical protein [Rubritalea sp.]|uniref:hypothetical protein n=1 Tax=Rubritalea sp. TaxID=2109375 RepID=UPI003EF9D309
MNVFAFVTYPSLDGGLGGDDGDGSEAVGVSVLSGASSATTYTFGLMAYFLPKSYFG